MKKCFFFKAKKKIFDFYPRTKQETELFFKHLNFPVLTLLFSLRIIIVIVWFFN